PIDYLVGTEITDNFGAGLVRIGTPGFTGQNNNIVAVTVTAGGNTTAVSVSDVNRLTVGMLTTNSGVTSIITAIAPAPVITNPPTITPGIITMTVAPLAAATGTLTFVSSNLGGTAATAGIGTVYYIQPIVFSCPGTNLFGNTSSVNFCGAGVP